MWRGIDLAQGTRLIGVDHAVLLPAAHAHHLVTDGEFGIFRLHHFAHGTAAHGLAQRLRRGVTLGVVHAATHVGVQAQKVVAHQHLAVLQCGRVADDQLEIAGDGFARGAVVEMDLLVCGIGTPGIFIDGG